MITRFKNLWKWKKKCTPTAGVLIHVYLSYFVGKQFQGRAVFASICCYCADQQLVTSSTFGSLSTGRNGWTWSELCGHWGTCLVEEAMGPVFLQQEGRGQGGLTAGGRARPSLRSVAAKQRTGCKLEQGSRSRYEERSQCNGAIDQDWGDAVMAVLEAFKAYLGQPWATCFGFSAETALSKRLA